MSSGITRPFGRLSLSPGHISDSLLTRSPLCIATPYDLHVLATPPAFRLSQDQTLQLNFLARSHPDARRVLRQRPRLTLSGTALILETSLSTDQTKTGLGRLLLPPCRLRHRGQSLSLPRRI